MKKNQTFFSAVLYLCLTSIAMAHSLTTSNWLSMDEKTGEPRAVIQFHESQGVYTGKLLSVKPKPGDTGLCSKCPGEYRDVPIKGLQFIWGLKKEGSHNWGAGYILDPQSGKIYRAKLLLKNNKLYVRGYFGLSILGRTEIWERQPAT